MGKEDLKNHYIYITYDIKRDKFYIGKRSTNFEIAEDPYWGSGLQIKRIIEKCKREGIDIDTRLYKEVLEVSESYDKNKENEKKWEWFFDAAISPDFYNIAKGGQGGDTKAGYTPEQMEEFSKRFRGENHPFFGRTHTEETKLKQRQVKLGKKYSEETRKKMSEAHRGEQNAFFGKKHNEETRERMSKNNHMTGNGWKVSGERNPNYGKRGELSPNYGRKHSEETLEKLRKPKSEEHKIKIGLASSKEVIIVFNNEVIIKPKRKEMQQYFKEYYNISGVDHWFRKAGVPKKYRDQVQFVGYTSEPEAYKYRK